VDSVARAYEKMGALAIGEDIYIIVQRDGQSRQFTAKVAAMPEDVPANLPAAENNPKEGKSKFETGAIEIRLPEFKNKCITYIPENYDPDRKYGVVIYLPEPGQADTQEILAPWMEACAERDLILLAPQSRDSQEWRIDEVEFIHRTLRKLAATYNLDGSRIAIYGNGVGGVMAAVYFHSGMSKANGLVVINRLMPSFVTPRPLVPAKRSAIYWACNPNDAARRDRQLDVLRAAKYPVTIRDLNAAGPLPADEQAELIRWIDSLDRF
ncbi:MAG: hypothetical protein N2C12_14250, partial [Planctomycetales bacterium]